MPLIVFEGIDGCGKSTQQRLLIERLQGTGRTVRTWREPGGTVAGERLRRLLLDPSTDLVPAAEVFAYQAARAQLVQEHIAPALERHEWVVLDRFHYSTLAYQAYALGMDLEQVLATMPLALGKIQVDRVFWLRLTPLEAARRRAGEREDRIELRGLDYQARVDEGYALLAARDPAFVVLDADDGIDQIQALVWAHCQELLSA
ncbi:MAG: dTMP kinase [Planctomycetota bacterium]